MNTWFERGEDDAKGAGDGLSLGMDRLIYARQGYKHWVSIMRTRRNLSTYREYLKGFCKILPFTLPKEGV